MIRLMHHKYRCVHCLTPHDALYRRLDSSGRSRNSDIQLLSCNCCCSQPTITKDPDRNTTGSIASTGSSLDPYCERELLIVVLDIILLRIYAYRHLLYNRYLLEMELQHQQVAPGLSSTTVSTSNSSGSSSQSIIPPYLIQLFLICVVLRSHISIISIEHHNDHNDSSATAIEHNLADSSTDIVVVPNTILLAWSKQLLLSTVILLGQILVPWIGIVMYYYSSTFYNSSNQKSTTKSIQTPIDSVNKFYLYIFDLCCISILYPCILFYTCTSILHIWENSSTVRTIGTSLLIPLHQMIFLYQILFINVQQQQQQKQQPMTSADLTPTKTKIK